ncbi:MAG: PrsW family intramembrane metalloprotease, partial [Candidatus Methylomirabilis sp.]|nr:PrsW family intramembrane metalloprotease [Deltaproteobacteria bacterium]
MPRRLGQFAENLVLIAIFATITAASGVWALRVHEQRPALERAKDYARLGLRLQARATFGQARAEAPDDVYVHYRYIDTFQRFEPEVIREYLERERARPESAVEAFGLGYAYVVNHRFEEALPWLERALERDPGLLYAEFGLGSAYYVGLKDLDAAETSYREETRRNPEFEQPFIALSSIYLEKERVEEAVRVLQEGRARADEPWRFDGPLYRILFYHGDYEGSFGYFLKFHMPHRYAPLTFFLAMFCFFFWLYVMRAERVTESVPWLVVTGFVFLGILSVLGSTMVNLAINRVVLDRWREHMLYDLVYSFVVIATTEETLKLGLLTLGLLGGRALRNPLQGMALGTSVALGFSFYENYIYLVAWGPQAIGDRFFASVLLHVSCTGIAGYHVGRG